MSPMKFITVSELKQNAKNILAEVQRTGQQVTVTVNGKPVVVLSPAREEGFSYEGKDEIQYAKHLVKQVQIKLKQEKALRKPKKKAQ